MKPKFKTFDRIPSYAICYMMYGDKDGLTDEDIELIDKFMKINNLGTCVSIENDEESYFCSYPAFGLPIDVYDKVTFSVIGE